MIKRNVKPTLVAEARHPRPTASSTIEGSGHHLRRLRALADRRSEGLAGAAGATELLKDRLALPVREVATLLGISTAAVRHMIARGELPGRRIGGGVERMTYIVPTAALLSWLEGSSQKPEEGAA